MQYSFFNRIVKFCFSKICVCMIDNKILEAAADTMLNVQFILLFFLIIIFTEFLLGLLKVQKFSLAFFRLEDFWGSTIFRFYS